MNKEINVDSVDTCAFEAVARYIDKVGTNAGIQFDEVDNETAYSNIIQRINEFIKFGASDNLKNVRLDSKAEIDGKEYDVYAYTNILMSSQGSVTLVIKDKSRDDRQYVYHYGNSDNIRQLVKNYLSALDSLNKSAQKNVVDQWKSDFTELIGYDFFAEFNKTKEQTLRNMAEAIAEDIKRPGIKRIVDNVKVCRKYYKKANGIVNKVKKAKVVFTKGSYISGNELSSLYEIKGMETNSSESDDIAEAIYSKLSDAEKKWQGYMEEYFKTGTIKELEAEVYIDKKLNAIKNMFKCPVAITVYDPAGQTVGYVGEDDIWFNDEIFIEESGDTKIIYTPRKEGYTFDVVATNYGVVSYTVSQIIDGVISEQYYNYFDIPVEKGTKISVGLPSGVPLTSNNITVSCSGNTYSPETGTTAEQVKVTVKSDSGKGTVTGSGSYHIGDIAVLRAEPLEGYYFDGWCEGDTLRKHSETYQLEVRGDIVLTAVFIKIETEESGGSGVRFTDVSDPSRYYYDPVYWAVDKGITNGYGGANLFSPDVNCKREQIVTFLWRMMGEPQPKKYASFKDVKPTDWYYKSVSWAAENGITVGLNDGTGRFGVGAPC